MNNKRLRWWFYVNTPNDDEAFALVTLAVFGLGIVFGQLLVEHLYRMWRSSHV